MPAHRGWLLPLALLLLLLLLSQGKDGAVASSLLLQGSIQRLRLRSVTGLDTAAATAVNTRQLFQLQLIFDQPVFLLSNAPAPHECPQAGRPGFGIRLSDLDTQQRRNLPTLLALECLPASDPAARPWMLLFGQDPQAEDHLVPASQAQDLASSPDQPPSGERLDLEAWRWLQAELPGPNTEGYFDSGRPQNDNELRFVFEVPPLPPDAGSGELAQLPEFLGSAEQAGQAGCELWWRLPAAPADQTPACPERARRVWLGGPDRRLAGVEPGLQLRFRTPPSVTEFLMDSLVPPDEREARAAAAAAATGEEEPIKHSQAPQEGDPECAIWQRQQQAVFVETHVQALGAVLGPVMDVALSPVMDQFVTLVGSGALSPLNEGLMASLSSMTGEISEKVVEGLTKHWPSRLADALTHRLGSRLASKLSNLLFLKLQQPLSEALGATLGPWLERSVPSKMSRQLHDSLRRSVEQQLAPSLLRSLTNLVSQAAVPTLARALVQQEDICKACEEWLAGRRPEDPPPAAAGSSPQSSTSSHPVPVNRETCRFCSLVRTPGFEAGRLSAHFSEYYSRYFGEYYAEALEDQLAQLHGSPDSAKGSSDPSEPRN